MRNTSMQKQREPEAPSRGFINTGRSSRPMERLATRFRSNWKSRCAWK